MSTISRIAFQIYLDGKIPEENYQSHMSMKRYLKEYEFRTYTHRDNVQMLEANLPRYLELYMKSDECNKKAIAAYGWLYCHGGIYMDCDLVIKTDRMCYINDGPDVYILQCSYPTRSLTNYLMASVEGCEFWLNVLDCALINERRAPEWSYDVEAESVTAYKNFDSLNSSEPLDVAYLNHGSKYSIVILEYNSMSRYINSIRTFRRSNPAAWRHVDWSKWLYIIGAIIIILLVIIIVLLFFYESWRIANKVREHRSKECKTRLEKLRSMRGSEEVE